MLVCAELIPIVIVAVIWHLPSSPYILEVPATDKVSYCLVCPSSGIAFSSPPTHNLFIFF